MASEHRPLRFAGPRFAQASGQIQRVLALVELLRGVAAFLAAPLILHYAETFPGTAAAGIRGAVWICFAIAAGGAVVAVSVFLLGRARLKRPDVERWLEGEEPALESPPLLAGLREAGDSRRLSPSRR